MNTYSFIQLSCIVLQHKNLVIDKGLITNKYHVDLNATIIEFRRVNNYKISELEEQDACSPNFIPKQKWDKYGIKAMRDPSIFIHLFIEEYKIVFSQRIYENLYNLYKNRKCSHNFINELNEDNKYKQINMFIEYENKKFYISPFSGFINQIITRQPLDTTKFTNQMIIRQPLDTTKFVNQIIIR